MRVRPLLLLPAIALSFCWLFSAQAWAGRQGVALFSPVASGVEDGAKVSMLLGQSLAEKLKDRFDVHLAGTSGETGPDARRRKARALGATYVLTGNVSRIGRTATLDLTLAPTEDPEKGRTVFVTAEDKGTPAPGQGGSGSAELPSVYREMAGEASAKLKLLFFGDGQIVEGGAKRAIPSLSGKVGRSRNISGEVISLATGDTDRDGKPEVVAAYPDAVVIYQVAGEDLSEKARIPGAGGGLFHVDVGDVNRNGIAEIIAVRYLSGRAISDVYEFDGKRYQRIAGDIPAFLRKVDLGPDGIVLIGQESDPATIFKGPVFRIGIARSGKGEWELSRRGAPLPLPSGTWVFSFEPVKFKGGLRYLVLGEGDRLLLLDSAGEKLWAGIDAVSGPELFLEAAVSELPGDPGERRSHRLFLPGRLFAADLDGDKTDEILVVNNIVSAGGFFENLRIFADAEVLCFGQHADRLELVWRTAQIESPAMDAFLDVKPGGRSIRVGIASRDKGKILGKFGEWRLFWVR
ncbi:MAG TPA: FG-GAP-like repeat-containing protein [Candidatus Deferrimicrobiaceae bacterium]|nr:FG-GAP-like repeat-containing protein [Candidatus Deferrimicrobiaceae bacterium]